MLIAIVAISYILAINVFGFRIVKIQKSDRAKNGQPTPTPIPTIESKRDIQNSETKEVKSAENKDIKNDDEKNLNTPAKKEVQTKKVANSKKTEKDTHALQSDNSANAKNKNDLHLHNGDKIKKDTLLAEEKLNFKRYERIPDLKIMLVAVFGGALGEFISFLVFRYRTTNTILMVVLPVLIALWVYLYYIVVGGVFVV